jgi:hypothetical protein
VIAGRALASILAACGVIAANGCDASITSVGSWTPDASRAATPEASVATGTYLEAESGALSAGFLVGDDPSASGGRYLEVQAGTTSEDAPGTSLATYELQVATAGTYFIWGRIRSPSTGTNRLWVQVDGGAWFKWRITVGDIWFWDRFHDDANYGVPLTFPLSAGTHALVLANCVDGVDLDRLYFTAGQETPPGNTTPCDPPNSIELEGTCFPSCGSQGGNTCGVTACSGLPALQAYDCDICCIGP